MTRVVNVRSEPFDVYIGRPMPGYRSEGYGNPYKVREVGRERAMELYREYFAHWIAEPGWRARIEALRGKTLGCWCKPGPCHGDVIVEWLENSESEK